MGAGGGLIEILYAATGFLHTQREVYEAVRRHWNLPVCNEQSGTSTVPYFMPMVVEETAGSGSQHSPSPRPSPVVGEGVKETGSAGFWYLADDFSFSYRARAAGFKIYADTTIRLGHIGRYAFSWEDAGGSNQRFGTYVYRVLDAEE